jgi:hypothetical protein
MWEADFSYFLSGSAVDPVVHSCCIAIVINTIFVISVGQHQFSSVIELVVLMQDGLSALSIAKHLGFISIIEVLKQITSVVVATPAVDYHYNIVFPETMHELMMESDEEGGGYIYNIKT